ncbi:MAG: type III-B CRISPR module RAMP protein Cmr4 [Candidatus Goldbacteria bacterium]|nr:type III-B CRISPR module RAMP protein Cmr4 [Candidatus Goldiibacteriota bacterium]
MKKAILFLETMSPLHAGSETSLGLVDKPIQREKVTEFPVIYSSSLKGAIREFIEENMLNDDKEKETFYELFGPEGDGEDNFASAISFTDAKILLFPVASVKDVYVYITCPFVLKRFMNDCKISDINKFDEINIENLKVNKSEVITHSNANEIKINQNNNSSIILTEFQFNVKNEKNDKLIEKIKEFTGVSENKICIISDDNFKYFVKYHTEIMARVKIGQDGTTDTKKGGNLWYEENIPIYTVFYSIINVFRSRNISEKRKKDEELIKFFEEKFNNLNTFIIGGNKTIGKGLIKSKIK